MADSDSSAQPVLYFSQHKRGVMGGLRIFGMLKKWTSSVCAVAVLAGCALSGGAPFRYPWALDSLYRGYAVVLPKLDIPLETFHDGYAAIMSPDGRMVTGFMDSRGRTVLEGRYSPTRVVTYLDGTARRTNRFYSGRALVHKEDGYWYLYEDGRLEKADTAAFTENRLQQAEPEKGVYVFLSPDTCLQGLMNDRQEVLIPPVWSELTYISDGCILARSEGEDGTAMAGILNIRGEIVCGFRYESISIACEQGQEEPLLFAQLPPDDSGEKRYCVLDTGGNDLLGRPVEGVSCTRERPTVCLDGKWYLLDADGTLLENTVFDGPVGRGENGLYPAQADGLWGYVDEEGDWSIPPAYEQASAFAEGYAAVETEAGWGYIDEDGDYAVEPQYEAARRFRSGRAVVYTGEGRDEFDNTVYDVSIIDTQGAVLQEGLSTMYAATYSAEPSFHVDGYFQYRDGEGRYHLFNAALEEVMVSPYEIASVIPPESAGGQTVYVVVDGKWKGLLNEAGEAIISPDRHECSIAHFNWRGEGFADLNGSLIRLF